MKTETTNKELNKLMSYLKNKVYGEVYHKLLGYVSLLDVTDEGITIRKASNDDYSEEYDISKEYLYYKPTNQLLVSPSENVENIDAFDYEEGDILVSEDTKNIVIFIAYVESYEEEYVDDAYYMFLAKKLISGDAITCNTNDYRRVSSKQLGKIMLDKINKANKIIN